MTCDKLTVVSKMYIKPVFFEGKESEFSPVSHVVTRKLDDIRWC